MAKIANNIPPEPAKVYPPDNIGKQVVFVLNKTVSVFGTITGQAVTDKGTSYHVTPLQVRDLKTRQNLEGIAGYYAVAASKVKIIESPSKRDGRRMRRIVSKFKLVQLRNTEIVKDTRVKEIRDDLVGFHLAIWPSVSKYNDAMKCWACTKLEYFTALAVEKYEKDNQTKYVQPVMARPYHQEDYFCGY